MSKHKTVLCPYCFQRFRSVKAVISHICQAFAMERVQEDAANRKLMDVAKKNPLLAAIFQAANRRSST